MGPFEYQVHRLVEDLPHHGFPLGGNGFHYGTQPYRATEPKPPEPEESEPMEYRWERVEFGFRDSYRAREAIAYLVDLGFVFQEEHDPPGYINLIFDNEVEADAALHHIRQMIEPEDWADEWESFE